MFLPGEQEEWGHPDMANGSLWNVGNPSMVKVIGHLRQDCAKVDVCPKGRWMDSGDLDGIFLEHM